MKVSVYDSFDRLPGSFTERSSYPCQGEFLLSNQWFSTLYETVLNEALKLRIYVVCDDTGDVLAILYCGIEREGGRLVSLTNYYSQVYAPVAFVDQSQLTAVTRCLVEYIAAERPRWKDIEFRYFREDRPEFQLLIDGFARCGYFVHPFSQYNNWYYEVKDQTFAEYFDSRPSRLKNTYKRKNKKLAKDHQVEIRVFDRDATEIEQGIADYTSVYNSSWKEPEPFRDFTPGLIRVCARLGILRLGILYVDTRPVATQLWITTNSKSIIYKLCYDEAYKKQSVGTILSHELFRIAIDEDGVREIDYGVGDEAYKRDWMEGVRQISGLEAISEKALTGWPRIMIIKIKSIIKTIRNR